MNTKIKYYLRGLGTGIIITTLILSIAFATRGKSGNNSSNELLKNEGTGKTVSESSTEESYKEKKITKKDITKKENSKKETTKKETTKEETTKKETTEKTTKKETTTEEVTTEEVTTEEATQQPTTKKSQTSGETVEISIYSGMTSEELCENLKQAGLIEDANDFNWYLNDNGYIRRIQVGTFTINKGDDYYAIAQAIIR